MVGINSSGQRIEMNWEEGPSPMQLALQMVGACSIVDVVVGLKERNFTKAWVDMKANRNDEPPRYFTSMHMVYHVEGDGTWTKRVCEILFIVLRQFCFEFHRGS